LNAFLSKMLNYFFFMNSLSLEISKIVHKGILTKQNLVDFSALNQNEKILTVKNGRIWFGFVGLSSNFMDNNFDFLILITFFSLKYFLIRNLRNRFISLKEIKIKLYLSNLAVELIPFTPFIIVSALSTFFYLG
jgi:hypothetical protein